MLKGSIVRLINAVAATFEVAAAFEAPVDGVALATGAVAIDQVEAIEDALNDDRFTFRSLSALQKAAGGISRDEVREIVFSLGGRQSSDGQELYTLDSVY